MVLFGGLLFELRRERALATTIARVTAAEQEAQRSESAAFTSEADASRSRLYPRSLTKILDQTSSERDQIRSPSTGSRRSYAKARRMYERLKPAEREPDSIDWQRLNTSARTRLARCRAFKRGTPNLEPNAPERLRKGRGLCGRSVGRQDVPSKSASSLLIIRTTSRVSHLGRIPHEPR